MHTGTSQELADKEQRSRTLAYQLAALLQQIQTIAPDRPITAHAGRITGLGFTLHPTPEGTWTVD